MGVTMKTWIIKDSDGNLPTKEEADEIKEWITGEASCPVVGCTHAMDLSGAVVKCEWRFRETVGRPTITGLKAQIEEMFLQLEEAQKHKLHLDAVELAAAAGDMKAIREFFGVEED